MNDLVFIMLVVCSVYLMHDGVGAKTYYYDVKEPSKSCMVSEVSISGEGAFNERPPKISDAPSGWNIKYSHSKLSTLLAQLATGTFHKLSIVNKYKDWALKWLNVVALGGPVLGTVGNFFAWNENSKRFKKIEHDLHVGYEFLTRKMKHDVKEMKGFVDQKVIELERKILDGPMERMKSVFSNCMREPLRLKAGCLLEAYRYQRSYYHKQALFEDEVTEKSPIKQSEARKVYVHLEEFRLYLITLLGTSGLLESTLNHLIDNGNNGPEYKKQLDEMLSYIMNEQVNQCHNIKNYFEGVEFLSTIKDPVDSCKKTVKCKQESQNKEENKVTVVCECTLDKEIANKFADDFDQCKLEYEVALDEKKPSCLSRLCRLFTKAKTQPRDELLSFESAEESVEKALEHFTTHPFKDRFDSSVNMRQGVSMRPFNRLGAIAETYKKIFSDDVKTQLNAQVKALEKLCPQLEKEVKEEINQLKTKKLRKEQKD